MASNYTYNRKTIDKLTVRGVLSKSLDFIECVDKEGNTFEVNIDDCLKNFEGESLTFTLTLNKDEDLLEGE